MPWSHAWASAITSFYPLDHGAAEDHFPTAVTLGPAVAEAILDRVLPHLEPLVRGGITVTDVGAGDGTLLHQLRSIWPPSWRDRTAWRGVDLRARPSHLDADVGWIRGDAFEDGEGTPLRPSGGLVIAHELLDDLPCDVLEVDDEGRLRVVLVEPATGHQSLGPPLDDRRSCAALGIDAAAIGAWCARWWTRREPAARVECGLRRDLAWRRIVDLVPYGVAVAMDYGHLQAERERGVWDGGTVTGYRHGRVVTPVPDGSGNITAHVAIDSCAAGSPGTHIVPPASSTTERTPDGLWWLVRGTMTP